MVVVVEEENPLQFVIVEPFLLCRPVPASSDLENYLYGEEKRKRKTQRLMKIFFLNT